MMEDAFVNNEHRPRVRPPENGQDAVAKHGSNEVMTNAKTAKIIASVRKNVPVQSGSLDNSLATSTAREYV